MDKLPNELLRTLFHHLEAKKDIHNLRLVNATFAILGQEFGLGWERSLEVGMHAEDVERVRNIVNTPHLRDQVMSVDYNHDCVLHPLREFESWKAFAEDRFDALEQRKGEILTPTQRENVNSRPATEEEWHDIYEDFQQRSQDAADFIAQKSWKALSHLLAELPNLSSVVYRDDSVAKLYEDPLRSAAQMERWDSSAMPPDSEQLLEILYHLASSHCEIETLTLQHFHWTFIKTSEAELVAMFAEFTALESFTMNIGVGRSDVDYDGNEISRCRAYLEQNSPLPAILRKMPNLYELDIGFCVTSDHASSYDNDEGVLTVKPHLRTVLPLEFEFTFLHFLSLDFVEIDPMPFLNFPNAHNSLGVFDLHDVDLICPEHANVDTQELYYWDTFAIEIRKRLHTLVYSSIIGELNSFVNGSKYTWSYDYSESTKRDALSAYLTREINVCPLKRGHAEIEDLADA